MTIEDYWEGAASVRDRLTRILSFRFPHVGYATCEDAMSQALIETVVHAEQVTGITHLESFLFQCARSRLWDTVRTHTRQEKLLASILQTQAVVPAPDGEVDARHDLSWYWSRLTPLEQERARLVYGDDMETARSRMERSRGSISNGLWKMRHKLQRIQADEETR